MFIPGLVSITFRRLGPAEVVRLVAQAGLRTIEWGGDVHVPPGDLARAREVRQLTADAGLTVAAYGSYYRAGTGKAPAFAAVLDSATALGAGVIRVWAGERGSAETDAAGRAAVADDLRRAGELAAAAGIRLALEWHGNTLTDTLASALALVRATGLPPAALGFYWQPSVNRPAAVCREELAAIQARLVHLHAFHWQGHERLPLADGDGVWPEYLRQAAGTGRDHAVLLEFVRNDDPEQFLADAKTLIRWLGAEAGRG